MNNEFIRFLKIEEILILHEDQIKLFGGSFGVRDFKLLESAVFAPQATFFEQYLYKDIFEMAAALSHGLIKNHPFIDGNKRTGTLAALIFLELNSIEINFTNKEFYELAINIAKSELNIEQIAEVFRNNSKISEEIIKH